MARLPRQLKALAGLVNFSLVFDPLSRSDFPHDVDIFASALQRSIEDATMPTGDTLIGDAEAQKQSSSGKILQGCRLDTQRHRAAAVYMVDSRTQFDFLRPARDRRKHHDGIRAIRLPFPKGSKTDLFGQFNETRYVRSRIMRRRVDLNVVDHGPFPSNYFGFWIFDSGSERQSNLIQIFNSEQSSRFPLPRVR